MLHAASQTLMYREAAEAGPAARRFLTENADQLAALGSRLRDAPPSLIMTCARGSSDHAATYGKYVFETLCHVPVVPVPLSIASVFRSPFSDLSGALLIAISQSGRSPDLLTSVEAHKAAGATIVALVNDITSPLAALADVSLPLRAGPELSVAATKSCIASMVGLAAIAAHWADDCALRDALDTLPDRLTEAFGLNWGAAATALGEASSLYVLGRGYGYGVAQEMALKLKETCALHAESFSAAEVRHGPMAIVHSGFPVLGLATSDASGTSVRDVAAELSSHGAQIMLADVNGEATLPARPAHPALEPVLMLASFYRLANDVALQRGLNPDTPPFLAKVTQTV